MNATRAAKNVKVTGGGKGVVAHVGAHLLASLADELGLTTALSGSTRLGVDGHEVERRWQHCLASTS